MNLVRERMRKLTNGVWNVRLWIQDDGQDASMFDDIVELARGILTMKPTETGADMAWTVSQLAELPKVNAVEVVDEEGNGRVTYNDWP